MASGYIAIVVFLVLAVLEPLLMLLGSRLIRRRSRPNAVKSGNYESAEESVGTRTSVMNEYLYYFPMFLAYEIVIAIMLIWVSVAHVSAAATNYAILGLFVFSFIFELFVVVLARRARE